MPGLGAHALRACPGLLKMPPKKTHLKIVSRSTPKPAQRPSPPPTVSPRWLFTAIAITLAAALFCAWGSLCILFWQGSWQLLYHPQSHVARTPASVELAYSPVGFAATETGQLRLQGWWIPAASGVSLNRFTVLYLHGATGNLGDSVVALARLHRLGLNTFAFDYRGYGQSQFLHPSEATWRQDADWALAYLTETRHIDPHAIVLVGDQLGADLALEVAAAHPNLAGVVLNTPIQNPVDVIFNDPRARLVPARELVHDRYDLAAAGKVLRIPSLWFQQQSASSAGKVPAGYENISARKTLVWLNAGQNSDRDFSAALIRWLNDLR